MKYLFTAYLEDGKYYEQNAQDVSVTDPQRSCFYDIAQEEARGNKVLVFCLTGDGHNYLVDLRSGRFEVDGVSFWMHDEVVQGRLIYFRRHTHTFVQGVEQISHEMSYNFGWQATINGENVKRIMTIY